MTATASRRRSRFSRSTLTQGLARLHAVTEAVENAHMMTCCVAEKSAVRRRRTRDDMPDEGR